MGVRLGNGRVVVDAGAAGGGGGGGGAGVRYLREVLKVRKHELRVGSARGALAKVLWEGG